MVKLLDYGYPLGYFKDQRREILDRISSVDAPPSERDLQELANIQLAIKATEEVIAEREAQND